MTYTTFKKRFTDTTQTWENNTWKNYNLNISNYDSLDHFSGYTGQLWDQSNSSWTNYARVTYFYNADNSIKETLSESWTNNQWKSDQKAIYSKQVSCVLAVDFLKFNALCNNKNINLSWQTTTEKNTSYFNIERSIDGTHFYTINRLNAAGNNNAVKSYSYTDINAATLNKTLYYRIEEIDKDGKPAYSKTISISISNNDRVSIFPNPASNKIFVNGGNIILVNIYSLSGKLLITQKLNANNSIEISKLQKGIYFIKVKDAFGKVSNNKLIVE